MQFDKLRAKSAMVETDKKQFEFYPENVKCFPLAGVIMTMHSDAIPSELTRPYFRGRRLAVEL